MYRVRQTFDDTKVDDISKPVSAELNDLSFTAVKPGHRVAITAGSRGIADIAQILRAIVEFFRALGAEPFIFPAMGSHGGATAEGQVMLLAQLGVTESFVKAPILSSMEVEEISRTEDRFFHPWKLRRSAARKTMCRYLLISMPIRPITSLWLTGLSVIQNSSPRSKAG
jgi:hypothetical protein